MSGVFGLPRGLAPEIHPHALQPGARVVEGAEISEERIQTEPCEGGVRIVSLDDGFRRHWADKENKHLNTLEGPICIPSHIGWKPVVQIGAVAFSELPEITKVIIPSGVRFIHQRAFYNCPKLKSVTIYMNAPDWVQVMGNAFPPGCVITYAQTPNSVVQGVQTSVNKII